MEVQRFLVGPLNTNCYLVQSKKTKETLLVDPGMVCDMAILITLGAQPIIKG